jgi:hypothetical protein
MTLPLDGRDVVWISVRDCLWMVPRYLYASPRTALTSSDIVRSDVIWVPAIMLGMRGRPGMAYVAVSGILGSENQLNN